MNIPFAIFRAYDIRGLYPAELNSEAAFLIGQSFAFFLKQNRGLAHPKIAVGRDNRTHGEELQKAFIQALSENGCAVTDIGLSTTPLLYFSVTTGDFDAGCNVSASHNPAQYNGFKLVAREAHAIYGEDIQWIYRNIGGLPVETQNFASLPKTADFFPAYLKKIQSMFPKKQGLKIVVDTGNGIAGKFYPKVIEAIGNTVIPLFTDLDGTFPNHPPDPIVEKNLSALKEAVLRHHADLGIAFDGDGDRLGIVDEKGVHWNSDRLAMLYAQDVLKRNPKASFVFTVSNSQLLFDLVGQWGGMASMCPVGHSYVEEAMHQYGAILGGEQSGHFFMAEDYFSYDDALVAACRLLQVASEAKRPVSSWFEIFPQSISSPEQRPFCPDDVKFKIMDQIKAHFIHHYPNANVMDGVRIDFGGGAWAGIRVSNTSPCLSICLEAMTPSRLKEIETIVLSHLRHYPEIRWSES